jgi:hypothetical protein
LQTAKLNFVDYDRDLAYQAIQNKNPIRLKGKLIGNGRSKWIENPFDLEIL